ADELGVDLTVSKSKDMIPGRAQLRVWAWRQEVVEPLRADSLLASHRPILKRGRPAECSGLSPARARSTVVRTNPPHRRSTGARGNLRAASYGDRVPQRAHAGKEAPRNRRARHGERRPGVWRRRTPELPAPVLALLPARAPASGPRRSRPSRLPRRQSAQVPA